MKFLKIKQRTTSLMVVIIISKITGLLRDVVLANYFGTTNISDAYLIALTVPTSLFFIIGHSLATAYIPMYNKIKLESGEKEAQTFSNNLLNVSLVLCTLLVCLLLFFPELVVNVFAAGFDQATVQIASKLIRISASSIYLMCVVEVFGGYLQANRNFLAPAAISLPRNLAIVISIVLAASFGVVWLGLGFLMAYLLETAFLVPFIYRKGYRYRTVVDLKDSNLQQTLQIVTPILMGVCVGRINKIIDRSMASTIIEGGISALTYASIINNAIQEVLVTGLITILFTSCSELVARKEIDQVKQNLADTIGIMSSLLIPGCVGVIILAEPIVTLILCRGEFDRHSLDMTVSALRCYTIGLLFLAIRDTLVKVFYAFKDTKSTTSVSILSILLNIILNLTLGRIIGIEGLALATSISAAFNCVMLCILLNRKIGDFGVAKIGSVMVKSALGSVAMGFAASGLYRYFSGRYAGVSAVFLTITISCVIYGILEILLANEAITPFVRKCLSKMR